MRYTVINCITFIGYLYKDILCQTLIVGKQEQKTLSHWHVGHNSCPKPQYSFKLSFQQNNRQHFLHRNHGLKHGGTKSFLTTHWTRPELAVQRKSHIKVCVYTQWHSKSLRSHSVSDCVLNQWKCLSLISLLSLLGCGLGKGVRVRGMLVVEVR